jgi:ComF family protein
MQKQMQRGRWRTVSSAARSVSEALLDLLVPRRCGLCGAFDSFLCDRCTATLPAAAPPRCPTCWDSVDGGGACRGCARVLVHSLAGIRSPYQFDGGARRLVHALKYDGHSALAGPMGRAMARCLAEWGIAPDVVVPVPLHRSREARRGFNQAAALTRSVVQDSGLPAEHRLLRRRRATIPQARAVDVEERRRNVAGAFAVEGPVVGRTVLLIDDVCTTGATLRACADTLRAAGAARVYGLTFARGL